MSLKGSLQTVALPEVLTFLAGTGKSGQLHVSGSRGDGWLWFDQGRIAGFDVARSQEPVEAIFQLLRIDDGGFAFDGDAEPSAEAVTVADDSADMAPALEAAEARMAEWRDVVAVVPSLAHRLTLKAQAPSEPVVLEPDQWLMVVAVGAGGSVGDVLDARGLQEFEGCRSVRSLVESSLVEVHEPEAAAAETTLPEVTDLVAAEPDAAADAADEPVEYGTEPTSEEPMASGSDLDADPFGQPVSEPRAFEEVPMAGYEAAPVSDEDHYAALRAAVVEIGDDIVPADDYDAYGQATHPVYELNADPQMDGRAALQALLSEVSDDGAAAADTYGYGYDGQAYAEAGEAPHDVDGLADRGPWTAHELSAMDAGEPESWSQAEADASNIVALAPIHDAEQDPRIEGPAGPDAVEGSEPEEALPVEEPINRGLLLKFLSSVRN